MTQKEECPIKFIGSIIGFIGLVFHAIFKQPSIGRFFYEVAWKCKVKNPNVLAAYGLILLKENNVVQAKTIFDKIIKEKPSYMAIKTIKVNLSICYWKLGDLDAAISEYEKIIADYQEEEYSITNYSLDEIDDYIDNNYILSFHDYNTLGYLYMLKEDYNKAEFFTRASLKLDKNNSSAFDNLGQLNYHLENYEKAKEHFMSALKINSSLADSNYFLGLILKKEGKTKEAMQYLQKASECTITGLNTITLDDIKKELEN